MHTQIVLPLIGYLLIVFAISAYSFLRRKQQNRFSDYFIGNRTMGGFLLAMAIASTYISASSFVGGPGAAYKFGLGWVLLAMIQVPTVLLSLAVLGKKFAILARQYNAITISDMLYARYGSRLIIWLASLTIVFAFLAAMTVQFVGGARLLESAAGIPYTKGLLIFGMVTVLYTALGGFRAGIMNDAFQGMVMLFGSILLLAAIIYAGGGITQIVSKLQQLDPQLLSPQGPNQILNAPFMASFWVLVCFAVVGLPHTAVRCMAYRDSQAVHRGIIIGTIVLTIITLTMHLAGALGPALLPGLTVPDRVMPELIIKVLPAWLAGIFLAAPLAAIMSTVNAQLLQISAVIIKDLLLRSKPQLIKYDKRLTQLSVLLTFGLGAILILFAWNPPDMLIWLNLQAFGGLEAVFLWPLVLGLYWSRANARGALSSMLAGSISYLLLNSYNIKLWQLHPIVPALGISLLAFVIGNRFATNSSQLRSHHALDSTQD